MVEKLLVAVVAGLFGLLPVLLQWLSARGAAKSRNTRITLLSEELQFLERWVNLSRVGLGEGQTQPGGTLSQAVQADLAQILAEYRSLREQELKSHARPESVSFGRRALLLFRPSTGRGWLIHTTFYFLTIFALAIIVSDYQSPTFDPETGENEFKYLLIGLFVIFGPILFLLRRAALRLREQELGLSGREER